MKLILNGGGIGNVVADARKILNQSIAIKKYYIFH